MAEKFTEHKFFKLTKEQSRLIKKYLLDHAIKSESELFRQAIMKYIEPDSYNDTSLKLQGLKYVRDDTAQIKDMIDILHRYITHMHINLLAYNPEIEDPEIAEAAINSANIRHDRFFTMFQNNLKNDPPFFERLLHTFIQETDHGKN